ncbi:MAG: BrnT family toxin [Candidatus Rokubacteria bacterium]|nr:BrnT family toxin [Candidatus Rokubacteria bacterium]
MEFEWDAVKATSNLRKHNVGFDEAATTFFDLLGALRVDEEHSEEEGRLLVTVFTERGQRRRIICSRPASRKEGKDYEEGV